MKATIYFSNEEILAIVKKHLEDNSNIEVISAKELVDDKSRLAFEVDILDGKGGFVPLSKSSLQKNSESPQ